MTPHGDGGKEMGVSERLTDYEIILEAIYNADPDADPREGGEALDRMSADLRDARAELAELRELLLDGERAVWRPDGWLLYVSVPHSLLNRLDALQKGDTP